MKPRLVCLVPLLAFPLIAAAADVPRPDTTLLAPPVAPGHTSATDSARIDNRSVIAAVRAADDERLAATKAADRARLNAVYSDDLHYAHSNGRIDTKASQIQGITTGANTWESFEHKERTFVPAAPGIVLMKGRVLARMSNKQTGQKTTLDLNYLAVWREEKGTWRFFAWQSCKNPP